MEAAQTSATHDPSALVREHGQFVWRALRRLGVPDRDADDQCQEVFLVVLRKIAEFEGRSSLRTWIYGICVRVAAAYRRRAQHREISKGDDVPEGATEHGQDDALERHRARAMLDRALDELDDDKRAVFVLFEIEQLSMNDVAEAVGCPLQTAYSRLHAAREKVSASLRRAMIPRRQS
ncbi:RNA polymerase sigma factor [soil metagenome]